MQQHTATFIAETEAAAGADPPQFVKDAFLECGMLAHGATAWASAMQRKRRVGFDR